MSNRSNKLITYDKVIFVLSCVFSAVITYFITASCIDSDASSELVLSNHLAETGRILSQEWGYSTEIRVLNTQLVYAPLFWIFEDWHMVRYFGALILQAILVGCYYIFVRLLDIDRKIFFLSSSLYLLPVSICYGRIVLYNCYYIPHIALSLVIVGLTFARSEGKSIMHLTARMLLLGLLSFLGGMGGIRQLLMTHAPIIAAVFIYFFIDDFICRKNDREHEKRRLMLVARAVLSAVFFLLGFIVNKQYFMKNYVFADYSTSDVNLLGIDEVPEVLYGFVHHFGFRDGIPLMSVLGVLSVLGVILGVVSIFVAFSEIKRYKDEGDVQGVLPSVFYISFVAVMLLVFLVLGRSFYFVLYFTPVVVWMIPVFVTQLRRIPEKASMLSLRRVLPIFAVLAITMNGIVNSVNLLDHTKFEQKYEGLVFKDRTITDKLEGVVDFLVENDYELGYATFWNGNIMTEMSDGQVNIINVHFDNTKGAVTFNYWLTLTANRKLEDRRRFLLLESYQQTTFERRNDLSQCELVYEDENYIVYEIKQ